MFSVVLAGKSLPQLSIDYGVFEWEKNGFQVQCRTCSAPELIDACRRIKPDAVFLDLHIGRKRAFPIIDRIRNEDGDPCFIILSDSPDYPEMRTALRYNVFDYLLKPPAAAECDAVLERLFLLLNTSRNSMASGSFIENRPFRKLVQFIDSDPARELKLGEVAELFGLNASYCSQLFKKHFGCGFSTYVVRKKIEIACYLLRNGTMTMEQIAEKTGFNDYSYFMKSFKRIMGETPGSYRKSSV